MFTYIYILQYQSSNDKRAVKVTDCIERAYVRTYVRDFLHSTVHA